MAARGFLGAGDLYVSRYDPTIGGFAPFEGPFESTKFELKPNSELKEMASKSKTGYGQVIESIPLPKPADLTVDLAEVNRESLAMALFGTTSVINQGSGTVVDQALVAKKGKWIELGKGNIATAGFVLTNDGATVTYVKDTDYIVNYRLGMVKILPGSAIIEDAPLKVDFTHNAITGTMVAGATQSQVRARFKLDGINFADQLPCITTVHEAVLTPDNAFDFLGDNFASISLKGRMKTPAGKSEPFTVELHDTAS